MIDVGDYVGFTWGSRGIPPGGYAGLRGVLPLQSETAPETERPACFVLAFSGSPSFLSDCNGIA